MARSWDVFCSVIDNYGDLGVCWRLASQLTLERKQTVRLWVDDINALRKFGFGAYEGAETRHIFGVEIRRWDSSGNTAFPDVDPAEIVIEGFGVRLPENYLLAMAKRASPPVWINLEYLSAEPWVETHHGLPSQHPKLPLTKYFFFPGFTEKTGGLLIESDLANTRDAVQAERSRKDANDRLNISLFSYENAAMPGLVEAWKHSPTPVVCIVSEDLAQGQVAKLIGQPFPMGTLCQIGALALLSAPFVTPDLFDQQLWKCDVNFVRGEDSFVRAQLAARPLVWQAYPQEDDAHFKKITALLALYNEGLEPGAAAAVTAMFEAWNRQSADIGQAWQAFVAQLPAIRRHAAAWADHLLAGPNLADRLVEFCENKLK